MGLICISDTMKRILIFFPHPNNKSTNGLVTLWSRSLGSHCAILALCRITRFFLFMKQLHQPDVALKSSNLWSLANCNAYALIIFCVTIYPSCLSSDRHSATWSSNCGQRVLHLLIAHFSFDIFLKLSSFILQSLTIFSVTLNVLAAAQLFDVLAS